MELLEQLKHKEHMYENMPNKYIDGIDEINKLNIKADGKNYNRIRDMDSLLDTVCLDLGQDSTQVWHYKFPITFSMIHNDTEVRVVFSWGRGSAQLDISFDDYANLPKVTEGNNNDQL
jgi:hypothetical protein